MKKKGDGKVKPHLSADGRAPGEEGSPGKSYYYGLVDLYLNSGQTGRALIQAAKNIAYNEDDPEAYINRARVYEKLGAWESAIGDLREALTISPDNRNASARLERLLSTIFLDNQTKLTDNEYG